MAEIQFMKKPKTPSKGTPKAKQSISTDHHIAPQTPQSTAVNLRRSHRLTAATPEHHSALSSFETPHSALKPPKNRENPPPISPAAASIIPASPLPAGSKRKRKFEEKSVANAEKKKDLRSGKCRRTDSKVKKKVYYKKVVYDGGEFSAGQDVYVKRRSDASSDNEDPEEEECRVCFKPAGRRVMIECDDCLNGFHLKCLTPPLRAVPDGDWICNYCEAKRNGEMVEFPEPPAGKKRARTARERLLSSDLWAARIESLWKEVDGTYWFRARWYIIPEETAVGRQPHNLRRELYRTNDFADLEMETIIRHCLVMSPKEFANAGNEGDDVFLCEYEYDIQWHNFKRIAEIDNNEDDGERVDDDDEDWKSGDEFDSDSEEAALYEDEKKNRSSQPFLIGLPSQIRN